MASIREQLIEAVKTSLLTITTGNGFNQDVLRVFRDGKSTQSLHEWPALSVFDRGDIKIPQRLGAAYDNTLSLEIKAFFKEHVDSVRPLELNDLQADIVKKLEEDQTFGGLARITRVTAVTPLLREATEPEAISLVLVATRYRVVQEDPDTLQPFV